MSKSKKTTKPAKSKKPVEVKVAVAKKENPVPVDKRFAIHLLLTGEFAEFAGRGVRVETDMGDLSDVAKVYGPKAVIAELEVFIKAMIPRAIQEIVKPSKGKNGAKDGVIKL